MRRGIVIRIGLTEDLNKSFPARNIDSRAAPVIKNVVRIPDTIETCEPFHGFRIQHDKFGRPSVNDKKPMLSLIQGHGKILKFGNARPSGDHPTLDSINDDYMAGAGHIHKDPSP